MLYWALTAMCIILLFLLLIEKNRNADLQMELDSIADSRDFFLDENKYYFDRYVLGKK